MCADSHLILDVDDMVRKIIDDCAQHEESREESQLERRMGGSLRVESEECRDEGDEEGGLGVESGGMENEEGRDDGHEEEGGIGVGCGGMGNEGGGGEPGEDSSSGGMGNSTTGYLERRAIDEEEETNIMEFVQRGCGCTMGRKGPCSALFTREHYQTMRADAAALTWSELNMVVMGEVMALTTMGSHNQTTIFQHRGHRVCRKTFLFLHGMGKRKFELIKSHFSSAATYTWKYWAYSNTCSGNGGSQKCHTVCHSTCRGQCHSLTWTYSRV